MKKLIFLLLFIPLLSFGQRLNQELSFLNSYKYVVIEEYRNKSSKKGLEKKLKKAGYNVINNTTSPKDFEENPNLGLYVKIDDNMSRGAIGTTIYFYNYNGNKLWQSKKGYSIWSYGDALNKAIQPLLLYNYKYDEKLFDRVTEVELPGYSFDIKSELSIRNFFDENGVELIEGIWEYAGNDNEYKIVVTKDNFKFKGTIIETSAPAFRPGDIKAVFETAASDEVVTIKWTMGDGYTIEKTVGTVKNNALIEFRIPQSGDAILYKVYPKFDDDPKKKKTKTGEWAGNGSGIIISKSGYIVTNHHVIEDADDIEVEFILNEEVQKFNAEIVQVDKVNDLAIIKIFDMNFDGVDELPYNFKTRSSDVGTKVYAFGYPMALTAMGKEIKITDGIISSKSGFDGDITTYQITAPIQGGNSGGPLFDDKGNFLGINSSGIRKDLADNVGYTIKSSYVLNLIDVLPKSIDLPSSTKLELLPLTDQIKEISKYVVLIKVK